MQTLATYARTNVLNHTHTINSITFCNLGVGGLTVKKKCIFERAKSISPWGLSETEKEYVKAVYCPPAYLISMQSTSCKMPGWMKHKLDSRLLREISITSDMHPYDTTLMAENEEELKSLLLKVKENREKAGLKLNIQKAKLMAFGHISS